MLKEIDLEDLEKARDYADEIAYHTRRSGGYPWTIEPLKLAYTLELLANSEDSEDRGRFGVVVDAYCKQVRKRGGDDPHACAEWLCRVADHDHDFSVVGAFTPERRTGFRVVGSPAGRTQELFQKLYGECFL